VCKQLFIFFFYHLLSTVNDERFCDYRLTPEKRGEALYRRHVNEIRNRVINTHRLYRIVWLRRVLANGARGSVIHTL